MKQQIVRPSAVAGTFYPGKELELDKTLQDLLKKAAPPKTKGSVLALISPHAGYFYSGLTAAHGYKLLKGQQYDCVVIVAPSHREYFSGISVYNGEGYQTPLGMFPVDEKLRFELLSKSEHIEVSPRGHGAEHAIEVQLPFLHAMLGNVKILPIVMGDQTPDLCLELGDALAETIAGKHCLLIASTDLSHYYPYATAQKIDARAIEDIEQFDYTKLMEDLQSNYVEACGGGPTVAVLSAAQQLGATKVQILHSCNSGDITGDKDEVVGYLSAAVLRAN